MGTRGDRAKAARLAAENPNEAGKRIAEKFRDDMRTIFTQLETSVNELITPGIDPERELAILQAVGSEVERLMEREPGTDIPNVVMNIRKRHSELLQAKELTADVAESHGTIANGEPPKEVPPETVSPPVATGDTPKADNPPVAPPVENKTGADPAAAK